MEPAKAKQGKSHINRILQALARVYEDQGASASEIIQAAKLASEVLERRPMPRRKTEKEKLVEAALGKVKARTKFGPAPKKKAPTEESAEAS